MSSRTRSVVFCGLIIALMVVSAWVTIPFGMIPVTLQVFVMIFALLFLPPKQYFVSLLIYITLGAIGLPVFSGMRGGIGVIAGPTGGFLWGFIAGALVAFAILWLFDSRRAKGEQLTEKGEQLTEDSKVSKRGRSFWVNAFAAMAFLVVMYLCGWIQLMFVAGLDPLAAFLTGVAPFILIDIVKMVAAILAVEAVNRALPRAGRF